MGTAGFLSSVIRYYFSKNKKFDIQHMADNTIYGGELCLNVFNLARANLLINTGKIVSNIH